MVDLRTYVPYRSRIAGLEVHHFAVSFGVRRLVSHSGAPVRDRLAVNAACVMTNNREPFPSVAGEGSYLFRTAFNVAHPLIAVHTACAPPQLTLTRRLAPEIADRSCGPTPGPGRSRDVTMDSADNQIDRRRRAGGRGDAGRCQVAADRAKAEARKVSDERRAHRRPRPERSTGSASRASNTVRKSASSICRGAVSCWSRIDR